MAFDRAAYMREYRARNREKLALQKREWDEQHPGERRSAWKKYREQNPEKFRAAVLRWQRNHPDEYKASQRKHKYGLTKERYQALLSEQLGCCAVCREPFESPQVDHCHATGKVRGLVCGPCNRLLAQARDNIRTLAGAIAYLERYREEDV